MNKMGLFIQPPGAGMDLIAKYKPAAVLLMCATSEHIREAKEASPLTDVLVWWHEDWRHWQTTDPVEYADLIAAQIKDYPPTAVAFWNENLSHDHHDLFADYDSRQAAFIDRMQDHHGIPVGGFAMGEGNFTEDGPNLVEYFPKSLARLQFIFIHEYWFPRIQSPGMEGYHCLRWPYWLQWLDEAGLGHIQVYVTECGLTSLINHAGPDEGWLGETAKRYGVTDEAYFDDLAYYHARCCEEPRIKAVIPFLAVSYPGEWETFRLTRNPALLDRFMALDAPGIPGPMPEPTPEPTPEEETMTIQVYDENQQLVPPEGAAQFVARYGIKYREPEGLEDGDWYWKLVKLEWKPTASWIMCVLDENGKPVDQQQTAWGWYQMGAGADDIKGNHYATDHYKLADLGPTNMNGHCGPGMSKDWYHAEFQPGPGYAWIRDPKIPSTVVEDIGMLAGTAHFTLIGTWQKTRYVGDGNGGNGNGLVFVERVVEPHGSAMLGIAVPTDYAVVHDMRGDWRCPAGGIDDTLHPEEWIHPVDGTRMAAVLGCADFAGDAARQFTMQAIDIASGDKLTDVIPEAFEPLGTPRERIVHVFAVGGPEPPTPPLELEEAVNRLRVLSTELEAIADYLASL